MTKLKEFPDPNIDHLKEVGELLDTEVKKHDLFSSRTIAGPTDLFNQGGRRKTGRTSFFKIAFLRRRRDKKKEKKAWKPLWSKMSTRRK